MKLFLFFTVFFSSVTYSVELTDEIIKNSKRIAIIKGTFDPITNGHIQIGENIINDGLADAVIYLPTVSTPHKEPLPYRARSKMIEIALSENPSLHFLKASEDRISDNSLTQKIRELNPKVSIGAVIGSDLMSKNTSYIVLKAQLNPDQFIISKRTSGEINNEVAALFPDKKIVFMEERPNDISSSKVRKYLTEHRNAYFKHIENPVDDKALKRLLPESLIDHILSSGLYLNRGSANKSSLAKKFFRLIQKGAYKVGLFDAIRDQIIKKYKANAPKELDILIANKEYHLTKYIGSGLQANTYIIEVEGEKYIIKIANERAKSTQGILDSIPVQLWARAKTNLNVPEVLMYSNEGKWAIFEFIEGETLKDYMVRRGDILEPGLEKQMKETIAEANRLYSKSYIKLDLNYDNFIIRDGKPYLVDLGTIPDQGYMPKTYMEAYGAWTGKFSFINRCGNFFKQAGKYLFKDLPNAI